MREGGNDREQRNLLNTCVTSFFIFKYCVVLLP